MAKKITFWIDFSGKKFAEISLSSEIATGGVKSGRTEKWNLDFFFEKWKGKK